jgi:hypothetical protein
VGRLRGRSRTLVVTGGNCSSTLLKVKESQFDAMRGANPTLYHHDDISSTSSNVAARCGAGTERPSCFRMGSVDPRMYLQSTDAAIASG